MGIPNAYMMQDSCSVGAPGIWVHKSRALLEGIVVFALGAFIYVGINVFRLHFAPIFVFAGAAPFISGIIAVHPRVHSSRRISMNAAAVRIYFR
jgi:hypothetical protein